jgi:hypothetical protein
MDADQRSSHVFGKKIIQLPYNPRLFYNCTILIC